MKYLLMASLICLVGCRSISTKTVTDYDIPTGKIARVTITEESKTPFINKWVNLFGWGYGFKIVLFDPQTGSYAPCIEAIGGRTGLSTLPIIGENCNTYYENLYIEKSMWSTAASVIEFHRVINGNPKTITSCVKINLTLNPHKANGTSLMTDLNNIVPAKIK